MNRLACLVLGHRWIDWYPGPSTCARCRIVADPIKHCRGAR